MKTRRPVKKKGGMLSVSLIVIAFLVVMIVQIVQLKEKETSYAKQKEQLKTELAEETERAEEIEDMSAYMQSDEYKEDVAKNKLGLAYENEIIFKEKEN